MAKVVNITQPGNNLTGSLDGTISIDEGRGRLIVSNTTNNVAILGFDDERRVVVKVAKPGFDANNATDEQLIFNSHQNIFKIAFTGVVSHTLENTAGNVPAGTQTLTIPHGLPFPTAFEVYVKTPADFIGGEVLVTLPDTFVLPAGHSLGGGTIFSQFKARVDATNLYIDFFHRVATDYSPSLPEFQIRYYLLQETAS